MSAASFVALSGTAKPTAPAPPAVDRLRSAAVSVSTGGPPLPRRAPPPPVAAAWADAADAAAEKPTTELSDFQIQQVVTQLHGLSIDPTKAAQVEKILLEAQRTAGLRIDLASRRWRARSRRQTRRQTSCSRSWRA